MTCGCRTSDSSFALVKGTEISIPLVFCSIQLFSFELHSLTNPPVCIWRYRFIFPCFLYEEALGKTSPLCQTEGKP